MDTYLKGVLITVAGVLVISPDTLLIRLIDADTLTQLFWRGLLSGMAVLLGFWILTGRKTLMAFRAMGWPGIFITLVFALGTLCFVYSATHTLIANTLLITATSPVFAAVIARFVLKEHVPQRTVLTIVATIGGIALIAYGSLGQDSGASLEGDLAALGGSISLAVTFSIARARKQTSMVPAMGLAGLLSAVFALAFAPSLTVPSDDFIWVVILGLLVVPLGFALLATGPRYLPAPDVGLLLLLESILGPLLVWWVLEEFPGKLTLIGGAILLAAMILNNLAALHEANRRKR